MTLFHPWLNVPAPGFYNDSPEGDKIFISGGGAEIRPPAPQRAARAGAA
jgi:hypothetical protein